MTNRKLSVLFVCLGNICRSPTAHGIFEHKLKQAGLLNFVSVDSCGTGAWHVGQAPDERTVQAAAQLGYGLTHLRARKLVIDDFSQFDYILAMDTRNLADTIKLAPYDYDGELRLFLDYSEQDCVVDVPDPYCGGSDGFDRVVQLVENASEGLLIDIKDRLNRMLKTG